MGNLGSLGVALMAFVLLMPVRVEQAEYSCPAGSACPDTTVTCYTLLGWENALGPLGCSGWASFAAAVSIGLAVRLIGSLRNRTHISK